MQRYLDRNARAGALFAWLLAVVSFPAVSLFAHSVPAQPDPADSPRNRTAPATVLVLGDSISAAYGMPLEQGWVALLAKQLAESHPDVTVVNASISGETTAGGLRRLPALLAAHRPALVLIELGANDGLRGFPLADLRRNLSKLADLSQQAGARVVIVPMEIPPNYGTRYTAGFRSAFQAVAADSNSALSLFILDGVALDFALMQGDGIHPTAAAQPRLLANVLPSVVEALAALESP